MYVVSYAGLKKCPMWKIRVFSQDLHAHDTDPDTTDTPPSKKLHSSPPAVDIPLQSNPQMKLLHS